MMDGRSRPFFIGIDQALNSQQKDALVQGIQHVIDTTPPDFDSFEFQFTNHQLYIYKLDQRIVLLVLTQDDIVQEDYLRVIRRIKTSLQVDMNRAIATFRLLASELSFSSQSMRRFPATTLNGQTYTGSSIPIADEKASKADPKPNRVTFPHYPSEKVGSPTKPAKLAQSHATTSAQASQPQPMSKTAQPDRVSLDTSASPPAQQASVARKVIKPPNNQLELSSAAVPLEPPSLDRDPQGSKTSTASAGAKPAVKTQLGPVNHESNPRSTPPAAVSPEVAQSVELAEMVLALNALSKFTTQYLGAAVIANYWKLSQSDSPWLKQFEIDRAAQISMVGNMASSAVLSPEQCEATKVWVGAFIDRCSRVIRDFRKLVQQSDLSARQKSLLLQSDRE